MLNGMMMGAPLPMMGGSYMADMATMGMPAMSHMALSSMAMPGGEGAGECWERWDVWVLALPLHEGGRPASAAPLAASRSSHLAPSPPLSRKMQAWPGCRAWPA